MQCFQVWFYYRDEGAIKQRAILLDAANEVEARSQAMAKIAAEGDLDFKISKVKCLDKGRV
jgi:hypothetical protein